ncbi:Xaa-Pro aminopeptidase [Mesorhizobium sp. CN2-181]|uniref:Xaa-Pro aminopeptidase n=1 Tax=Mesorhizobium yinganensis TaxID=3157707 RepID=UPI0032B7B8CC
MAVELRKIAMPDFGTSGSRPVVPASTYEARVKAAYERAGCDWLAVYADREHFGNIVFLTGFEPRFEETFLLLGPKGERVLLTGNESESYAPLAGLPGLTVLVAQSLSLMGQDRTRHPRLADRLRDAGLRAGDSIGLVGWKYLEPNEDEDAATAFFVPAVHVRMFERLVGPAGAVRDVTPVLMHPETGLRAIIDADQIAAFEWASTRVSLALWRIVSGVREGDDEFSAAARMNYAGDPLNVHTMLSSAGPGETVIGLRSPIGRKLTRGDGVTTAIGYWGALSSRAGLFDAGNEAFLKTASAYFEGLLAWYEAADIGVTGGALHEAVVGKLAQGGLRSALNPGHLTGHEEWMNTPVRPGSTERLASGMPFQVDVIPVPMPAGWTLNCEDPVTFADAALRDELKSRHPWCFARIEARRAFMRDELGVVVKESILPLSSTPLCLPPFWLKPDHLLARA